MFTKIDELMWKDQKFKNITKESKLLFIYLLSCQHRNVLGLYNLPKFYIQGDLGYPIETVTEGLAELTKNGFITYHEPSETVLVNNFLKYNPLNNPNQVKGAAKVFPTIPKTPLFFKLLDRLKVNNIKQSDNLVKAVSKYIEDNGYERVSKGLGKGLPKGMGKQEEVEVEVEVKEEEEVKEEVKHIKYDELLDLYNNILGELSNFSKLRSITDKRKDKLRTRFKDGIRLKDEWEELFIQVKETPFTNGDNDRGWVADFDWLIDNDTNYIKVLEGKYKDKKKENTGKRKGVLPADNKKIERIPRWD